MSAPEPIRRYIHPEPQESWDSLAQRASTLLSSEASASIDVATLQSWNLHLALRPPSISITPIDIVFVEPPHPDGG